MRAKRQEWIDELLARYRRGVMALKVLRWEVEGNLQEMRPHYPAHRKTVKRLAGEVPLPFPVTTTYTYFNSETGQESQPTPAQELARLD